MNKTKIFQNKTTIPLIYLLICLCTSVIIFSKHNNQVFANTDEPTTSTANPPETNPSNPLPSTNTEKTTIPIAKVTKVNKWGRGKGADSDKREAGIGDTIIVTVENYQSLMNESRCLDSSKKTIPNCNKQEILLVLDGRKIPGITAKSINYPETLTNTEPKEIKMMFDLERNSNNNEIWAALLGAPELDNHFFERKTTLSISLENGVPIQTDVDRSDAANQTKTDFHLVRVRKIRFWVFSIGFFVILILLIKLGKDTNLLRSSISKGNGPAHNRAPYSLGHCQMAVWFLLVIGAFLYIWLITGSYEIITTSALALIGIGAGAALGAATIDSNKYTTTIEENKNLEAEKTTLKNDITDIETKISLNPANVAELQQQIQLKQAQIANLESKLRLLSTKYTKVSQGFLNDILNDNNGISFHRFQMFVWTIALASIFIYSVWDKLSMPEFNATLLALQGISAGTYLGFKIPEKL